MRIIGGTRKGQILFCPKSSSVRPTTDFLREYIYDVINYRTSDAVILDLFAGTGSLGLEALSRGAATAIFVEKNRNVSQILVHNIQKLKFDSVSRVVVNDVFSYLHHTNGLINYFDLIFADPPYQSNFYQKLLNLISDKQFLKENGLLILEHDKDQKWSDSSENLSLIRTKQAGNSTISIFKNQRRG